MEETVAWVLRIVAFVGIGLFLWSIADSVEKIAQAFRRIAGAMEKDREIPPPSESKE